MTNNKLVTRFLGAAWVCAVFSLVSAGATQVRADVRVLTWGGAWLKTFQTLASDYEAKTGVKVSVESMQGGAAGGLAKLKAQKDSPEVDVWTVNLINYERALGDDLLEAFGPDQVPNIADVPKSLQYSHGVAAWVSMRGIAYRADLAPFEIKTWNDLWDPRLKGKVGAPQATFQAGTFPIIAAKISGGDEKNIDPGFKKLAELKPNITTFYKSNTQAVQLLENGEVSVHALVPLPNFYKKLGGDSNIRFVSPTNPSIVAPTPITLIKNGPNKADALKFINFVLSADSQDKLANAFGSAPSNAKVKAPGGIAPYSPNMDEVYRIDFKAVDAQLKDWSKRYNREIQTR